MKLGRRRSRGAPLRWGGAVAAAGLCVLATGAYLQFTDAGAEPPPATTAPSATAPSTAAPPTPAQSTTASSTTAPSATPRPSSSAPPAAATSGAGQSTTSATRGRVTAGARPTEVKIPTLGVDAPVLAIEPVHAVLTPPSDPSTVGWWSGGAAPGATRGSTVITGHAVHTGGGAFDSLGKLVPGAVVQVTTGTGQLQYKVATVTTYRKATLARRAAQVFDQSVAGRLVLVTCEDWNGQVYLSNVVVIALPMA
ncbi:sortase [Kribbella solani]|uniref:class F sortase n=1 Tax=Kribbella solani TaxID=236067 RepID=UPI0029AE8815|nr:sortase [Kribbella solani]MDX3004715.1 sortase [Kribbella solani]